jgi:hypothetical protein
VNDHGFQFEFIVDNQALADIASGKAYDSAGVCGNILNALGQFILKGLFPRAVISSPVSWRPREFNSFADAVCNIVIDDSQDCLVYLVPPELWIGEHKDTGALLQFHSDGASRGHGSGGSSAAWSLTLVWISEDKSVQRCLVAYGGTLLNSNFNAFQAEVAGLELAVKYLQTLILGLVGNG